MRLKPAEHLYSLQAIYPNYDISGPFKITPGENGAVYSDLIGLNDVYYLLFTSKSDQGAFFYQAYEYSVWENYYKKPLRFSRRIDFIKCHLNYSRTNLRSAVVALLDGETHPMRGYGAFTSLNDLANSYLRFFASEPEHSALNIRGNLKEPRQPPEPKRKRTLPEGMEVPERVPCMHCGLPVVLTRNRRYLYIYKNRRNFLHTWCNENFLAKQRAEALNARRERSLLRKQGAIMPIKFTHYIAKPTLNYKDASTHGEEFFSNHYEDIGKDYIPAQILASVEGSVMLGASESTIIELIKRWLDTKDAMRLHTQGPSFMLFRRIPLRGKASVKEFIHASW